MNDRGQDVNASFAAAQRGDREAFADWLRLVEAPLWRSLRSYAAAVDIEGIVQEALLRMWRLAPTLELSGPDASLRFVHRIARNLANSEARRRKMEALLPSESLDERPLEIAADDIQPELEQALEECKEKLPHQPARALRARLELAHHYPGSGDDVLAEEIDMRLNAFHKNLSRARKFLTECLQRAGFGLEALRP